MDSAGDSSLEELLEEAAKFEKEFDWSKAIDKYELALGTREAEDKFRQGTILDSISHARFKIAFKSASPEEFKSRLGKAIESFEKSKNHFENQDDPRGKPWEKRCDATLEHLRFWQSTDWKEKRAHLAKSWDLVKESLVGFDDARNGLEYCKTYLRLSIAGQLLLPQIQDYQERMKIQADSLAAGEKALGFTSDIGEDALTALIYARTACISGGYWVEFEPSFQDLRQLNKSVEYWTKASEISEIALLDEFPTQAIMGVPHVPVNMMSKESRPFMVKALDRAWKTGDRFQIGCVLSALAEWVSADMYSAVCESELDEVFKMSVKYTRESSDIFATLLWPTFVVNDLWIPDPDLFPNATRADVEADLRKKREYAERAFNCLDRCMSLAKESGCAEYILTAHEFSGYTLSSLAKCEKEPRKRRDILERSIKHRKRSLQLVEVLHPIAYATLGWSFAHLSELDFELHLLAADGEEKRKTLEEAVQLMEKGLEFFGRTVREAPSTESQLRGDYSHVLQGRWATSLGIWLIALNELNQDRKLLERAIQAFDIAADYYRKADMPSRRAEVLWESAKAKGLMGDHIKASESFLLAADEFGAAVKKVPRLKEMCEDYGLYMRAWAEIEQARHSHLRQDYGLAGTHYDKAAELHSTTRRWNYLSTNYRAWAQIEGGEDLSRNDDSVGAAQAFGIASSLFVKSAESIRPQILKTEDAEERRMAEVLVKAAATRQKYCDARVALEEARALEKKGQGHLCSEKYSKVASMLQEIQAALEVDQDKKEIELILTLTKAWQAMCRADAEESSDFYLEASALFERAKELSSGEKARLVAMGHSRFCKALEAGTKFTDSGDSSYHAAAVQHLESAAKYYLKAGLESASEFANASKLLFDGYVYMGDAGKEKDQSKKAKLYAMTEKVFQASALAYNKAGYPGKRDHVEKLLERVRADRELAVSLTEVLSAPDVISNTVAFTSPTPTHERATGVRTFEHAYVQATLIARPRDLHVGDDLSLDIELVNAGRSAAQLTKVEEIAPSGFDILNVPEKYRIEDSYLNMRGWKLDALKTEDVKVVLKPNKQGNFTLRPRVMYMDESGEYKSYELQPVEVRVKELGVSGWLKGPDRQR